MKRFLADLHRITTITDAALARSAAASIQANGDIDALMYLALNGPQSLEVLLDSCRPSGTTTDSLRRLEMLGLVRNRNGGRATTPDAQVEITTLGRSAAEAAADAIFVGFRDARAFVVRVVELFGTVDATPASSDRSVEELALIRDFCRVGPGLMQGAPATPFDPAYAFTILAAMCMADDTPGLTLTELADFCGFAVQRIELVIAWLHQEGFVTREGASGGLTDSGREMLRDFFATKLEIVGQTVALLRRVLQLQGT